MLYTGNSSQAAIAHHLTRVATAISSLATCYVYVPEGEERTELSTTDISMRKKVMGTNFCSVLEK